MVRTPAQGQAAHGVTARYHAADAWPAAKVQAKARTLSGRVRVAVPLANEHLDLAAYRGTS
jgi:hypothetical protein